MLEVKVIASGSSGNCTLIRSSGGERILLDAGISMKRIMGGTGYEMPDYVLITHEHCDHALPSAVKKLLTNGAEFYMTKGTREALDLKEQHNLHTFEAGDTVIKLGDCEMTAFKVKHDAAEPVAFQIYDGEDSILYATDMGEPPQCGATTFTKIIIEANHSSRLLRVNAIGKWYIKRVKRNHLSIEKLAKWFIGHKFPFLKEVHLIHISEYRGNGEQFREFISGIVNVPVYYY